MEKIKIITDTSSDITLKDAKEHNIELLPITIEYKGKTYLEQYNISKKEFWDILNNCDDALPSTAQISAQAFLDTYKKLYNEGYTHIIVMPINAAGSGTYNSASLARTLYLEEGGDENFVIELIDTHTYSYCYGRTAVHGAALIKEGRSFNEVLDFIKGRLRRMNGYAYINTLKFARKSGRISGVAAIIGEALGLKPIMRVGNSSVDIVGKCRGEKMAISKLIENVKKDAYDIENEEIIVIAGDMPSEIVEKLINDIKIQLNPKSVYVGELGCSICNNAGPQTLGILYMGREYDYYK